MTKRFEIGQRFIGNWGAMLPIDEGTLIRENDRFLTIEWDSGEIQNTLIDDISMGRSINGSPIGIFPEEIFMNL